MHTQTKKTLAFVISSLRMGGAEKVASFLANHFVDSYDVILVLWSDENRFFEVDKRVKIIVLPAKMRGIFGNIERIFGLIKCFKSFRVDLTVSFIHQTNILAIIASKIKNRILPPSSAGNGRRLKTPIFIVIREIRKRTCKIPACAVLFISCCPLPG